MRHTIWILSFIPFTIVIWILAAVLRDLLPGTVLLAMLTPPVGYASWRIFDLNRKSKAATDNERRWPRHLTVVLLLCVAILAALRYPLGSITGGPLSFSILLVLFTLPLSAVYVASGAFVLTLGREHREQFIEMHIMGVVGLIVIFIPYHLAHSGYSLESTRALMDDCCPMRVVVPIHVELVRFLLWSLLPASLLMQSRSRNKPAGRAKLAAVLALQLSALVYAESYTAERARRASCEDGYESEEYCARMK